MLFIEIDNEKYPMKAQATTTQSGKPAIRIISDEAPLAMDGFNIVDGNGNLISDKSAFKYLYREDEHCKEYTTSPEEIIPVECHYMGDQPESPYSVLSRQISAVSSQVSAITPYEESKTAYIGDTEVRFDNVPQGNISAYLVVNGLQVPCEVVTYENYVIITFEELEEVGTVTISVQ